jgi:hypothetical protein
MTMFLAHERAAREGSAAHPIRWRVRYGGREVGHTPEGSRAAPAVFGILLERNGIHVNRKKLDRFYVRRAGGSSPCGHERATGTEL